ncbi:MAG: hypothetical protein HRT61_01285 [Ekhidna sp.]|nr:hypothetical protein [Ekhidna sp.]
MRLRITNSVFFLLLIFLTPLHAQLFVEKQTRHRFAQNLVGFDIQTSIGGNTFIHGLDGSFESYDLPSTSRGRIVMGGTHFWGHADIYIAIPIMFPRVQEQNQDIFFTTGVETVFKFYPWQLEYGKFRPYVGLSLAPNYFEQDNNLLALSEGPQLTHVSVPLLAGLSYMHKNKVVEAGITWNYANRQDYYFDRFTFRAIETPPLFASFALKFMFDTTVGAEDSWESGRTEKWINGLAKEGKLNGFFIGAGLSSAWWMGKSSYNQENRPFVKNYGISLMGDFSLGYYWHKPDLNVALVYRGYGSSVDVYGVNQALRRRSFGLEVTKYVLDYHGFDPFIGPVITNERLSFKESVDGILTHDLEESGIDWGITFGWDIRPDRNQSIILRTSLRYFPALDMQITDSQQISFDNMEFNFIQLVFFPNRM